MATEIAVELQSSLVQRHLGFSSGIAEGRVWKGLCTHSIAPSSSSPGCANESMQCAKSDTSWSASIRSIYLSLSSGSVLSGGARSIVRSSDDETFQHSLPPSSSSSYAAACSCCPGFACNCCFKLGSLTCINGANWRLIDEALVCAKQLFAPDDGQSSRYGFLRRRHSKKRSLDLALGWSHAMARVPLRAKKRCKRLQ